MSVLQRVSTRAATAFAGRVRDETDLARVEGALVATVDGTLAPASRTRWVRERQRLAREAETDARRAVGVAGP